MRCLVVAAITCLAPPSIVSAQATPAIDSGVRVRITEVVPRGTSRRGTVVARSRDTVVMRLDPEGETVSISLAQISGIDVSRGVRRHPIAGIGVGFLAGAATGALAGALSCGGSCRTGSDGNFTGLYALIGAGIGGAAGIAVGGMIGATRKTERWERLPASQWSLSARPHELGGLVVAVSRRF